MIDALIIVIYTIGMFATLALLTIKRLRQIRAIFEVQLIAWVKSSGDPREYVKSLKAHNSSLGTAAILHGSYRYSITIPQPYPISFWNEEVLEPSALIFFHSIVWPLFILSNILRFSFIKLNQTYNKLYIDSVKSKVISSHKLEILTSPNAEIRSLLSSSNSSQD